MLTRRTLLSGLVGSSVLGLVGCSRGPKGAPVPTTTAHVDPAQAAAIPRVTGVVADGLNVPWGIAFRPDGRALVAQRDAGSIVLVDPGAAAKRRITTVGEVSEALPRAGGEGGLLGLALDPDDSATLFAYLTTDADDRIVRIELRGDKLGSIEPILTGIPVGSRHHGGRLVFGPDGHLYVGTGDATRPGLAQSKDSLGGKILRLTRDGDVELWSMGHRNVEGLAFDPDDRLWASEFGNKRFDELNLIYKGGNYGWPAVEGDSDDSRYVRPKVTWTTDECSPSGLAIAKSTAFVAALRGECLWSVPLDGERVGRPRAHFVGRFGRLRTVMVAPDGDLWLSTSNSDGRGRVRDSDDRILRVRLD
jgi:glucose/arabinose dehydrogenase